MQVTETLNDGLKRGFSVVVTAQALDGKLDARINEIKGTIRINGFRPGKVPAAHIKKTFGKALLGEILETVIDEGTKTVLDERALRPADRPKVEITDFDEGKDLAFKIELEVMPEIPALDAQAISLDRPVAAVSDEDVEKALAEIGKSNRSFETKDGAAANGDVCVIDFDGSVDGVPFEGGKAERYSIELGSGAFIPGFEDQLIGAKAGDDISVNVKFPDDYGHAPLAGKAAVFAVKVHEVKGAAEAALDDDFAKKIGFDTLDALKDAVRGQVQRDYDSVSRMKAKRALLDVLDEKFDFELPPGLLQREYDAILETVKQDAAEQGGAAEDMSDADKDDYHKIAKRRVRLGLLLAEVGRLNGIQITQDELSRAVADRARRFPGREREIFELYSKNPQALDSIRAPLYEEKVVDFVLALANINDVTVSREELFKEPEEDETGAAAA